MPELDPKQKSVKVDQETYDRLQVLAGATERSIAKTIKIAALNTAPEDLVP